MHSLRASGGEGPGTGAAPGVPDAAIHFGDIHDPTSKVAQILATREYKVLAEGRGAKPQIYYLEP